MDRVKIWTTIQGPVLQPFKDNNQCVPTKRLRRPSTKHKADTTGDSLRPAGEHRQCGQDHMGCPSRQLGLPRRLHDASSRLIAEPRQITEEGG